MKNEKKKSKKAFFYLLGVFSFAVAILVFCQIYFDEGLLASDRFVENTSINGIDVSNLTTAQAQSLISAELIKKRDDVSLELSFDDKIYKYSGKDFEVTSEIGDEIDKALDYYKGKNAFVTRQNIKKIKKEGVNLNVSYKTILAGLDSKIDEIANEINQEMVESKLMFAPDESEMFYFTEAKPEIIVDKEKLLKDIDESFINSTHAKVAIPTSVTYPILDKKGMLENIKLRGEFKTDYSKSGNDRKNNIKTALSSFNGKVLEPQKTMSFNETTGLRDSDNGYRTAHIIVNGQYVDGMGGGVCQASTTVYNCALLSGLDVIEVNHHTLPASYVSLSFDAMVSGDYSDLKFINNTNSPIYIKAWGDDNFAHVQMYGTPNEYSYELKSELVKILPHNGDKIVKDTSGEYESKVLYEGEYFRLSYPREGYESKGYLVVKKDDVVIEQKLIRHDYYQAVDGIVIEGGNEPFPGMVIPATDVKIIKPQIVSDNDLDAVRKRLEKINPTAYNQ